MSWLQPTLEDAFVPLSFSFETLESLGDGSTEDDVDQATLNTFPFPPTHLPTPPRSRSVLETASLASPVSMCSASSSDEMPITPPAHSHRFDMPWDGEADDDNADSATIRGVNQTSDSSYMAWNGVSQLFNCGLMLILDIGELRS